MEDSTCRTCRFFNLDKTEDQIREGETPHGTCRFSPPEAKVFAERESVTGYVCFHAFPPVDVDSWCGKWEAKK